VHRQREPAAPANDRFLNGIALDATGNIALAGAFRGTLSLGGACSPLVSAGDQDMFVAKLDPDGDCLWAQAYGSDEDDGLPHIDVRA